MWQAKFLSYAHFKFFKKILLGTTQKIKVSEEHPTLSEDDIKENLAFDKLNDQAYSMLNLCVKDDISFGAVYNAITEDLPEGDAYQAWQNLQAIYKPISSAKKHELEQTFNKSSLDK